MSPVLNYLDVPSGTYKPIGGGLTQAQADTRYVQKTAFCCWRGYLSADKSVPANGVETTLITLVVDSAASVNDTLFPAGADSSIRKVTQAGLYLVRLQVLWQPAGSQTNGRRSIRIRYQTASTALSGSVYGFTENAVPTSSVQNYSHNISRLIRFNGTDYVGFTVLNNDTGAQSVGSTSQNTFVEIIWMAP